MGYQERTCRERRIENGNLPFKEVTEDKENRNQEDSKKSEEVLVLEAKARG